MGSTTEITENRDGCHSTHLRRLIDATEHGWIADKLVRFGMRRMLRQRLRGHCAHSAETSLQEFIRAAAAQPIAVATEKANEQHYDVPAPFFQKVLGPHLKYSCCYWDSGVQTLAQAEERALQLTCENAELENGMKILELGCGWGSLSLWMAEHYPASHITAVSNSHSQRQYIQAAARARNLENLHVITADINDFEPESQFTRIVSVEMFEHVRNHQRLLHRISKWLHPSGKLFVHIFCHRETPYLFHSFGESNWMGRYFFSGGMMPSFDLLPSIDSPLRLEASWKWNGNHYAKTCRHWLTRQDAARKELQVILAGTYGQASVKVWNQRWRMFFMACEELFAFHGGEEWFVAHYRFSQG